ncbi:hypothetical protein [Rhodospirillum rubrum]|uniref:hypothetical protein n=1 Tax=Rhodospirillum rubrum TaxID=1085 RepID=UPI000037A337|nr:hypothetical protein [Rhodospirillum rubrum]QXG80680.1 hypothetical protein KUL73_00940 [Rhodospirillum rubrum]
MALRTMLEKGADTDVLRDMIGFADRNEFLRKRGFSKAETTKIIETGPEPPGGCIPSASPFPSSFPACP